MDADKEEEWVDEEEEGEDEEEEEEANEKKPKREIRSERFLFSPPVSASTNILQ